MAALRTRSQIHAYVAAECRAMNRHDLAELLLGAPKPGPKSNRDKFGCGPHDYNLAKLWRRLNHRINVNSEDEGDVIAEEAKRIGQKYDYVLSLWLFDGYSQIRGILNRDGKEYIPEA